MVLENPTPQSMPTVGTLPAQAQPQPPPSAGNPILAQALGFAGRGVRVFPLIPGRKEPITKHGHNDATVDPAQIQAWWARTPNANLGLATGATSGLVVVDLDNKNGKHGTKVFETFLAEHNDTLPPSRVRTTTGGVHLYFRHPGKGVYIPCTSDQLGRGIDVRGDGGYIVAPPSRTQKGVYTVEAKAPLPNLPPWLLARLIKPIKEKSDESKAAKKSQVKTPAGEPQTPEPELKAALRRLSSDNYDDWVKVGMALKDWNPEAGFVVWEEWSRTSPKFEAGVCFDKWKSFSGANHVGETVTVKTILALAKEADEALFTRLAQLDPATYDRVRDEEAKKAGLRTSVLDSMVAARRSEAPVGGKGCPIPPDPEPWPEPVNGAELFETLTKTIKRFLIVDPKLYEVISAWVLHTYLFGAAVYSPILGLISPEKRCGKSVGLELLAKLASRCLVTSNATPAALYRAIEAWHPTLLIDEFDSLSHDEAQVELRNILNSGFKKDGSVLRCEGEDNLPTPFTTFCAKAVASIGSLPETAMDRAIAIPMRRKLPSEVTESLREYDSTELKRQCVRWAQDHIDRVTLAKPALPEELNDRQKDIWEPLFAIVDVIGGEWPNRIRQAALSLCVEEGDDGLGVMLLDDIHRIFQAVKSVSMPTKDLLERLNEMVDRPWPTFVKGQYLTPYRLSKLLAPYRITSRNLRFADMGGKVVKGWQLDDFAEAFERYLPKPGRGGKGNPAPLPQNAMPVPITAPGVSPALDHVLSDGQPSLIPGDDEPVEF